jgi:hypothetical protein
MKPKHLPSLAIAAAFPLLMAAGCEFSGSTDEVGEETYFLRDLRPAYFPSMRFESEAVQRSAGAYENSLRISYEKHKAEFDAGRYVTKTDSLAFGLEAFYYGFLLTGNVTAVKDGNLSLDDLLRDNVPYAASSAGGSDTAELNARMRRGGDILTLAANLRASERRVRGSYWNNAVYAGRFANPDLQTPWATANEMARFALEPNANRAANSVFPNYDLLITLITFRYTEDSAFTFRNPMMDSLLQATIERLNPNAFLGLDGLSDAELAEFNFVGILGPVYRLDLILRKAQDLAQKRDSTGLKRYLAIADSTNLFLSNRLTPLVRRWPYRETLKLRTALLGDLKSYMQALAAGDTSAVLPDGETVFRSRDFRQAYQCYNCHRHAGDYE